MSIYPSVPDVPGVPPLLRNPVPSVGAASFSGNVMNLSSLATGAGLLGQGQTISGNAILANTQIVSQISGAQGGIGSYLVSRAQSLAITQVNVAYIPGAITLLSLADPTLFTGGGITSGLDWGIFDGNSSVIAAESFVKIEFKKDFDISTYPVELGAFESYNKVQNPGDARVMFSAGSSEAARQALFQSVVAIIGDLKAYDIVTPLATHVGYNAIKFDYKQEASEGVGLLQVAIYFEEIVTKARATFSQTSSGGFDTLDAEQGAALTKATAPVSAAKVRNIAAAAAPSGASRANAGTVQPQPVTSAQRADVVASPDLSVITNFAPAL